MDKMHIDNFIDGTDEYADNAIRGDVEYARWILFHKRLPAVMKVDFDKFIADKKLFCTYKKKRYRCTGGSRLGDVWLTSDFTRDIGYDIRVDLGECFHWSKES